MQSIVGGGEREPEQAVCQGLQLRMRSLYTHVPFLPRCRSPSFAIFSTVPPFVLLSQSHGVLSPSPECVEAFSLSHPPLIQRLVERGHFHKIHTVNIDNTVRTYCIIYAVNYKSKTNMHQNSLAVQDFPGSISTFSRLLMRYWKPYC